MEDNAVSCFIFETSKSKTFFQHVWNFTFKIDLPFPMNLSEDEKTFLIFSLGLVLSVGLYLRGLLFSYLRSPETKMIPINCLLWVDQLNGMIMATIIVYQVPFCHKNLFLKNNIKKRFNV